MKINFTRRVPPITENAKMYTDEHVLPKFTAAAHESFGPDFNLIRAVREYGPTRVEGIKKELLSIEDRKQRLMEEMNTLVKMIAATE
jgi:hypothetical protein